MNYTISQPNKQTNESDKKKNCHAANQEGVKIKIIAFEIKIVDDNSVCVCVCVFNFGLKQLIHHK